jgi:hypothetical protein
MKKNRIFGQILFVAFLLAFFSVSISAQGRQLLPVDEAEKDASFKAFRDKLIEAVKKRDAKYVLSVVDPNIKNGFGGNDGIANFRKQWKIPSPNSELWDELLFVLTNGGTFSQEGKSKIFLAPYVFSRFPDDLDAFEYSAIVGTNVRLRAKPNAEAPVVANLSYNIVKVDYQNSIESKPDTGKYTWYRVETLDGKKGFVASQFVRSSIDYRAGFEKKRGQWKMFFFLAGD